MRLLITLLVAAASLGLAQSDPVVATVGKVAITKSQFDLQFRLFVRDAMQSRGMPFSEEGLAQFNDYKGQFLERLAKDRAIIMAAEKAGFGAKTEEVESALAESQAQFDNEDEFNKALMEAGIPSQEVYRGLIYEALTYNAFIESLVSKLSVSEPAMRVLYYLSQDQITTPRRFCSAHILVATAKEANEVIKKLGNGGNFAELAKQLSQDPGSKEEGGNLGCEPRGTFVAPFELALIALQPGQITKQPVKTEFGYHVILLIKIEPASVEPFDNIKKTIDESIRSAAIQKLLDSIAAKAGIELFPDNLQ